MQGRTKETISIGGDLFPLGASDIRCRRKGYEQKYVQAKALMCSFLSGSHPTGPLEGLTAGEKQHKNRVQGSQISQGSELPGEPVKKQF